MCKKFFVLENGGINFGGDVRSVPMNFRFDKIDLLQRNSKGGGLQT
jgi:hypothetical protein